jgi:hypothetical protein
MGRSTWKLPSITSMPLEKRWSDAGPSACSPAGGTPFQGITHRGRSTTVPRSVCDAHLFARRCEHRLVHAVTRSWPARARAALGLRRANTQPHSAAYRKNSDQTRQPRRRGNVTSNTDSADVAAQREIETGSHQLIITTNGCRQHRCSPSSTSTIRQVRSQVDGRSRTAFRAGRGRTIGPESARSSL